MDNHSFSNVSKQAKSQLQEVQSTLRSKSLTRSRDDRMIAGVCGGLAAYTGVDATLIRIALVAAVVLGFGTGALLYLVGWLLMPEEDAV